jgi:anti-anti-sigma regulatory factor
MAVLVGTGRRARLLGGSLRLAAPTPAMASALRAAGLDMEFDIFPTVQAAVSSSVAA